MKNLFRFSVMMLAAAAMTFCFTACGGGDDDDSGSSKVDLTKLDFTAQTWTLTAFDYLLPNGNEGPYTAEIQRDISANKQIVLYKKSGSLLVGLASMFGGAYMYSLSYSSYTMSPQYIQLQLDSSGRFSDAITMTQDSKKVYFKFASHSSEDSADEGYLKMEGYVAKSNIH